MFSRTFSLFPLCYLPFIDLLCRGYKGGDPNQNPICGRKITATCEYALISWHLSSTDHLSDKGKSVTVAITDRCVGCAITDLDFSPAAFNELASPDAGRLTDVKWTWN